MREPVEGVYPGLADLARLEYRARGFTLLPRQPVHSLLAGQHGSRLRGRGLNFDELRAYVAGDDVRSIDWAATARLRTPYVRIYMRWRAISTLPLHITRPPPAARPAYRNATI